jgi:hypothetical protein
MMKHLIWHFWLVFYIVHCPAFILIGSLTRGLLIFDDMIFNMRFASLFCALGFEAFPGWDMLMNFVTSSMTWFFAIKISESLIAAVQVILPLAPRMIASYLVAVIELAVESVRISWLWRSGFSSNRLQKLLTVDYDAFAKHLQNERYGRNPAICKQNFQVHE